MRQDWSQKCLLKKYKIKGNIKGGVDMSQLSIGIIETVGLAAAIEAADVCLKSANVSLIGYELTKGSGMAVVKIEGNVGAVNAAIQSASVAVNNVNRVYSQKVMPRPSDSIESLIRNKDTVGYKNEKYSEKEDISEDENKDLNIIQNSYTCNLCKDPECPRVKGDLRSECIHYDENNEK